MIKYSGAGNTFVILKGDSITTAKRSQWVIDLCDPIEGISLDGVLFLDPGFKNVHFKWDFYNSNGSHAEMCGNAARCATQFAVEELNINDPEIIFSTASGLISCHKAGNNISVLMPAYQLHEESLTIRLQDKTEVLGTWLNTGVPHFAIIKKMDSGYEQFKTWASVIRHHPHFGAAGTNVTLLDPPLGRQIQAVTFERGVEDFTLACGTGAVAAAVVAQQKVALNEFVVKMPGGEIAIQIGNQGRVTMIGLAKKIAEITWFHK